MSKPGVSGIKVPGGSWLIECSGEHGPLAVVLSTGDDDADKQRAKSLGAQHLRDEHDVEAIKEQERQA